MQDCSSGSLWQALSWQIALNGKITELIAGDNSLMKQHLQGSIMHVWMNATHICAAAAEMLTCMSRVPGRPRQLW